MKIVATQYLTRQSPRKVRLVVDQVKGLPLPAMLEQLSLIERQSCEVILKTLRQALANAQHNHGLTSQELQVKSLKVMEGPRYRRYQPVSRGRAHGIIKRTCHVQVVLESLKPDSESPASDTKTVGGKPKQANSSYQNEPVKSTNTTNVDNTPEITESAPELVAKEVQKSMALQPQHLVVPKVQPKRIRQRRTGV